MVRKKILVDIYLAHNLGDDMFLDHLSHSFPDIDFVPFHPGKNYLSFFKQYPNVLQFQYIFKKNLFIENDIFFQKRINMQDSEILPKLIYRANNLIYTDKCIYNYVQHKNSYTNTSNADKRLNYFKSIIAVENSLLSFGELIREKDSILFEGIQKKRNSLHKIVFNHLIFFSYSKAGLIKIINYLKENKFYPLKHNAKGKFLWIKYGLNNFPVFTKRVIDYYLKQ